MNIMHMFIRIIAIGSTLQCMHIFMQTAPRVLHNSASFVKPLFLVHYI